MGEQNKAGGPGGGKRKISRIEIVGMALFAGCMVLLLIKPSVMGDLFNAMFNRAKPIVVDLYLASSVTGAILISVMMGRLLERLGFTDALMRIFVPLMKYIRVNAAVAVPAIYNILGDVNAAGRIGGPILKKAGATKDEQKIAIATMMQGPSSFSIVVFGIICMTAVNAKVFLVFVLGLLLPVILVPLILRFTIWRDTKAVMLTDMPVFTPSKPLLSTVFDGAKEGAEILFLLIIPACAVVYSAIGALEYFKIWPFIQKGLETLLGWLNVDPTTGSTAILAGGTVSLSQLMKTAAETPAPWVVATFIISASSPLQVIFGQIPNVWKGITDLNERDCIIAGCVGLVIRLITAGIFGRLLIFLW
jgi:hypothetical protein